MFSPASIAIGVLAAYVVGVSKTALPGAGLVITPLIAMVATGREIPGATVPLLLAADVFAIAWYRRHTRWDLLRRLTRWVWAGFALGAAFFIAVGNETRVLELTIGVIVLFVVGMQVVRVVRDRAPAPVSAAGAAAYGTAGGFTTFVSNTAGPVMNSYLISLRLDKHEMMGTSAWFYFAVNLAKLPFYVALGELTTGGRFFTGETLAFDAVLVPVVVVGAFSGRWLFARLPQRLFLWVILVLSAAGALKLLLSP